jgi:hypothetical protein
MAIAVGAIASTALGVADKLGIGGGPSPDDERFAKIQEWYRLAINGDKFSLCKLRYYSGQFGPHDCGAGVITGWATQDAKDYDFLLYNQAVQVLSGALPRSTPIPEPGSSIPNVANSLATISDVTGKLAGDLGATQGVIPTLQTATQAGKTILVLGFVALIAFMVWRAASR